MARFLSILTWLQTHKDEIDNVIAFIRSLLAVTSDGGPNSECVCPDGCKEIEDDIRDCVEGN
jgi:hypothetical protein